MDYADKNTQIKKELCNDKRFYVDQRNLDRLMNGAYYDGYSVNDIKVGDILRYWQGYIYSLYETRVFSYLNNTAEGRKKYKEYVDICGNVSFRSERQYEILIEEIRKNPYDIKKGAIFINQYNFILEGQHRCCILLKSYGPDYKIKVVRLNQHMNSTTIRHMRFLIKLQIAKIKNCMTIHRMKKIRANGYCLK